MVTIMTKEELEAFKEKLFELVDRGGEEDVREYVNYYYERLPEDVRNEILFNTLFTALKDEVRTQEIVLQIQEEGLAVAEKLQELKDKLEREKPEKPENT